MKIISLKNTIKLFLILTGVVFLIALGEVIFIGDLYPYALLSSLSFLSFSSFLLLQYTTRSQNNRLFLILTLIAFANAFLLLSFIFDSALLKYCWNYSFGLTFLFPAFYVIQLLKKDKTTLTNSILYLTILTTVFFEFVLVFKISEGWVFNLLAVLFGLVTLLTITYFVTNSKELRS